MSVKRTLEYDELVVDGDMSANVTSDSTNILHIDRVGYQLSWTGTPTGTFTVEVSNDQSVWVAITLDTAITASGSADQALIDVETAAKWIRLKYTRSSGSGVLQVHIVGKSISG